MGSSAPKKQNKPRFPLSGSAVSSVGVYKDAIGSDKNHATGKTAKDRRTKGNSKHLVGIPGRLWHCDLCDKDVSNIRECIEQHKQTQFHEKKAAEAAQNTTAPQDVQNVRMHHCDTCNTEMDNTPQLVNAHYASHEHTRLLSYFRHSDSRPDGPLLAARTAAANDGNQWIAIKKRDGHIIHKLVKRKANKSKPAGTDAACACDVHRCCLWC
jgi:hypothetical protein